MGTHASFVEYVCDQLALGAALRVRRMFGEYAIYLHGRVVALACDDILYVKDTPAGRALRPVPTEGQPFPGAKAWLRADAWLDDGPALRDWLEATAAVLPAPKPKPPRAPRAKGKRTRGAPPPA